jgi:hypothetical protein
MTLKKTVQVVLVAMACLAGAGLTAQDKNMVKVPDGLGFADFKGYEDWQAAPV